METVADRITLFRVPLMESCRTMEELREEIRITLLHELGHYFGFEENDLEERGAVAGRPDVSPAAPGP